MQRKYISYIRPLFRIAMDIFKTEDLANVGAELANSMPLVVHPAT
jgi:hypothetical protein